MSDAGAAPAGPDLRERIGRTRVICLGLTALDLVWQVDELFRGGSEKLRSSDHATLGGGMAATAAVAVSRLGGRAAFWGRAGADAAGEEMRRRLADEGVDVSGLRLFPDGRSSVSGVIVDGAGERQIANFRGRFPEEAGWLPIAEVAGAACVLADPRWVAGARALFAAARAAGIPSVLDADMADPEVFGTLLPLADHAVFSEPALLAFAGGAGEDELARIARYGCRVAAVTRGARGVTWRADGLTHSRPAFPVAALDTTGAGDVFHGAYGLGLGAGLPVERAMRFAQAAAALKCTRPGGRAGIPTLHDILFFEESQP